MENFNIYIHGTPNGQKIWGPLQHRDYIASFYNRNEKGAWSAFTQIDICGGDTFYTYIRQTNVIDAGGRPEGYFAITISFKKAYCTNVALLEELLEALYKQICLQSILQEYGNNVKYVVTDFENATYKKERAVSYLLNIASRGIQKDIEHYLQALPTGIGDTFAQSKRYFNVKEVDSPIFNDACLRYSVIVSPDIPLASSQAQKLSGELRSAIAHNSELEEMKNRLDSQVNKLAAENRNLSAQLQEAAAKMRNQYEQRLNEIQQQLERVKSERDEMALERDRIQHKLNEAGAAIGSMEVSLQQLSRLMAGRFPDSTRPISSYDTQTISVNPDKYIDRENVNHRHSVPIWRRWLNTALLMILILISCLTLYSVTHKTKSLGVTQETEIPDPNPPVEPADTTIAGDTEPDSLANIDWTKYRIDISGNGAIKPDKKYILKAVNDSTKEEFIDGSWKLITGVPNIQLENNSFYIPKNTPIGTHVTIKLLVNDKDVLTREWEVQ